MTTAIALETSKGDLPLAIGLGMDYGPYPESEGKDPAAVALGRKGGKARAEGLRRENARKSQKSG